MKKLVSLVLAICMLIGCSVPAYASEISTVYTESVSTAANTENIVITVHDRVGPDILAGANAQDVEILNGLARATTLPTAYCDLSIQIYLAQMKTIGNSKLYTNKYFSPDENNEIHVDFTVYSQDTGTLRVGIYNMNTGAEAYQDFTFTTVVDETIWFSNLTQGNTYAVYFQSVYNGTNTVYMNGAAQIFYPSVMFG